ncbi:MAG: ferritin family protein [bacterium]|nr:ferritin family protein [bacterium]
MTSCNNGQECLNQPFRVELPYPVIKAQKQNSFYGCLLYEDYAGEGSEFTATASYMHHSIVTASMNEEISCLLRQIGIAEMTHISMLGKLLTTLGCSPKFQTNTDGKQADWNASCLTYNTSLKTILAGLINGEEAAIEQYQDHIKKINDCYVTAVLERIVLDEQLHYSTLKYYYDKYIIC